MIKSPHTQDDEEFNEHMRRINKRTMIGAVVAMILGILGMLITYIIHQ